MLTEPWPESGWARPTTLSGRLPSGSVSLASTLMVSGWLLLLVALSGLATGFWFSPSLSSRSSPVRKVGSATEGT
ncbi:hypothetical protein D3C86_2128900 [compost metagenome]